MGDRQNPIVPGTVAVCVLRLEPHNGDVLITVTLTYDVLRDDTPHQFVTLDVERAISAVRGAVARLRVPQSPDS